jgi:pyroglutamyl-peptidase
MTVRLRLLITGFGPFPGAPFNPTARLAHALAQLRRPAFADLERTAHVFDVTYAAVDRALPDLLARHRPDVLLIFGLATRARAIRIETRARNRITALWPDAGRRHGRTPAIAPGGPALFHFGPHVGRLLAAARTTRLPVRASHDAGRYLCNYLSYRTCEAAQRSERPFIAAFIHVPPLTQGARPRRAKAAQRWTGADLLRAGEAMLRMLAHDARQARLMPRPA